MRARVFARADEQLVERIRGSAIETIAGLIDRFGVILSGGAVRDDPER